MHKSDAHFLIQKTNRLKKSLNNLQNNSQESSNSPICIFIVGLPRSGSTLIESIISLNSQVSDLGEINIFEDAYQYIGSGQKLTLEKFIRNTSKD